MEAVTKSFCNKIDMYGAPITLNFKGKSRITTKVGALFSLFTISMGLAYGYAKITALKNRSNTVINQYTEGMNLFESTDIYNL